MKTSKAHYSLKIYPRAKLALLYQTLPCHNSQRIMMHQCMTSMVLRNGSQKGKNNWQNYLCWVNCQGMAELNNRGPARRKALYNLYGHNNTTKKKTGTGQRRWNTKDLVTCKFFSVTHHRRSGYFLPGKCLKLIWIQMKRYGIGYHNGQWRLRDFRCGRWWETMGYSGYWAWARGG